MFAVSPDHMIGSGLKHIVFGVELGELMFLPIT